MPDDKVTGGVDEPRIQFISTITGEPDVTIDLAMVEPFWETETIWPRLDEDYKPEYLEKTALTDKKVQVIAGLRPTFTLTWHCVNKAGYHTIMSIINYAVQNKGKFIFYPHKDRLNVYYKVVLDLDSIGYGNRIEGYAGYENLHITLIGIKLIPFRPVDEDYTYYLDVDEEGYSASEIKYYCDVEEENYLSTDRLAHYNSVGLITERTIDGEDIEYAQI